MKAISIALIFVLLAGAQQPVQTPVPAPQTAAAGIVKFQANTQLVIETVTVKDKNGKPVEGLTAKDLTITEDGAGDHASFRNYDHGFDFTRSKQVVEIQIGTAHLKPDGFVFAAAVLQIHNRIAGLEVRLVVIPRRRIDEN